MVGGRAAGGGARGAGGGPPGAGTSERKGDMARGPLRQGKGLAYLSATARRGSAGRPTVMPPGPHRHANAFGRPGTYPAMPRPMEVMFPSRKERFEDRRREGEHRKLRDEFFDHRTLLAISRLVTQGEFEALDYPIATGKEGGVFRASGAGGYRAVKVYRIGNAIFRAIPPHVLEAFRRDAAHRNFTQRIYAWTRREHTILGALQAAHVRAPEPYGLCRNVLVMEFVGADGQAAPRLRDALVEDPPALYAAFLATVRRMVVDARLVHGDLSPFNVLLCGGEPVLIDVAQAIPAAHPQAADLLARDLHHFGRYFERIGVSAPFESMWELTGGPTVGPREA